jgi:tetratricopeptide (TPR) repeat protein
MKRSKLLVLGLLTVAAAIVTARGGETKKTKPDLSLTAVGRQHHPIATKSREAQDYFDQGMTFIFGFNHEEAASAFQAAAELDPASPMPLWGIALAVGPNYNMDVDAEREKLAYETIQKARKLAEHAPQIEKDYVAVLAVRYSGEAKPDYKQLSRAYAEAMRDLSRKYPDDLDAATLYAESLMNLRPWQLWSHDGKPAEGTEEIVRVLESVLARDPNHAGANHYHIHALEASPNPERALPSASRLETLVPQAGHLVHMPAHIYARTGNYAAAAKCNEISAERDRVYAEKAEKQGSLYDLMYHSHNEHFRAAAASMEGRYAEAKGAADALAARLAPHAKSMPMLDGFIMTPLWVDARFGKWDPILQRPEPAKELTGTHAMWRFTRALAYAARGDAAKAAAERGAMFAETSALPPEAPFGMLNKAKDVFSVAQHVLDARIAAVRGKTDEAIAHWRKAVEAQDALNYDEPPDWYYPVRESLGAALLATGRAPEAEKVFREDLQRNPRNPRSLFGLEESLKAQKKDADAAWVQREFEAGWKNADTALRISDL